MTTKIVFSEFRNTHKERVSTEEFIQRCKTASPHGLSSGISSTVSDTRQKKLESTSILEQPTVKTFIKLVSEIATRCQSLEDTVKGLQNQVSNLETTVQDLCKATKTDQGLTGTKLSDEFNAKGEVEDHYNTTEDLKERLQQLQWKTFDLNRQNELLRRMLEIQCTVNRNAAASSSTPNEKPLQKKDTKTEDSTIQQADSTSNHSNTQSCTNPCPQQPSGALTADEEYVPLSAEEMLSLSFVDPKVPWSANDGTDDMVKDSTKSSKTQEPEIKCAYVYAPCPQSTDAIRGPCLQSTDAIQGLCPQSTDAIRGTPHKRNWYIWERKKYVESGN